MENPEEIKPITSKSNKNPQQKLAMVLMLEAGFEFAFLIAAPLLAGIFIGKWLDFKYHRGFFVIIGILLGLAITVVAVGKRANDYKKLLK